MKPRCVPSFSRYDTKEQERKKQESEKASRVTSKRLGMSSALLLQGNRSSHKSQEVKYYHPSNRSSTSACTFHSDMYKPVNGK